MDEFHYNNYQNQSQFNIFAFSMPNYIRLMIFPAISISVCERKRGISKNKLRNNYTQNFDLVLFIIYELVNCIILLYFLWVNKIAYYFIYLYVYTERSKSQCYPLEG